MNDIILQQYKDYVWGKYQKRNTRLTFTDHPRVLLRYINKPLGDATQEDIDRFVKWCFENRTHNGNAIRFWVIRQFLNWAKRPDLSVPQVSPIDAGKQALNEENAEKLLSSIEKLSPAHRLVFYLEYDTIRRPSEVRDVKLSDRYGNILRYEGKTKDSTGIKQCVMTERLIQAWEDYIKVRPLPRTPKDGEYLLLIDYGTHKGEHPKTNLMVDRHIKELAMYAQIEVPQNEKPSNYLIKRTSITRQLKECNDPKIIQMQAGHSKLETTMKYNRINEEDIKNYLTLFEHKRKDIKAKSKITEDKSF